MRTPIRLTPQYKEMIWGGQGLRTLFGRDIPSDKTGESWDIHADNLVTGTGQTLQDLAQDPTIVGEKVASLDTFPLLVKIITPEDDLSIQVHPDDEYARRVEGQPYGKTECWYVLDAPADARLIIGLSPAIQNKAQLRQVMDAGKIGESLNYLPVTKGDFLYIPAGLVHAITQGVTILEVQQTSDLTYRMYDYDRLGLDGNPRELHVDKSVDVIKYDAVPNSMTGTFQGDCNLLVSTPYFTVEKYTVMDEMTIQLSQESASIFTCTQGELMLVYPDGQETLAYGESVIMPVGITTCKVVGSGSELIRSYY